MPVDWDAQIQAMKDDLEEMERLGRRLPASKGAAFLALATAIVGRMEAVFGDVGSGGGGGGGTGDVEGPASATDNALVRFDGTTGKAIQNSSASLSDAGLLTTTSVRATGSLDATGATITGISAAAVGADPAGTGAAAAAAAVAAHEALGNPHPVYLTATEGAATFEAFGATATHAGLSDPHPGYVLETREGAALGIATLDAGAKVPTGQIPDLSATYQPLDADLTAVASLSTTGFIERTGPGTATARTLASGDLPSHTHSAADLTSGGVSQLARLGWSATSGTATTADNSTGTSTNTPSFVVTAGESYLIEIEGTIDTGSATTGWRCRFQESDGASSSLCVGRAMYVSGTSIYSDIISGAGTWTVAGNGSTARSPVAILLHYHCTGSGTLTLAIRSESLGSTVNLYGKTLFRALRIP